MIRDLLQESYNAMRHNRRRTALTMLGMAWGIATVVMLLAYGDGFGRACANIFANFGTKLFIVVPGRSTMQAGGQKAGAQTRITLDDIDLLTTNIPQITHITPSCDKKVTVQYDTRSYTMDVSGEYPNTFDHPRSDSRAGTLLQPRGSDTAGARRRHRLGNQGKAFLRTQRPGRTHPHRWHQL